MPTHSNKIWQDNYTIHTYHVDRDGLTTMASICDFLQESAWAHANSGSFGYEHLKEQKLIWVLAHLLIKVHRFPKWTEKIQLNTWSKGMAGILADRDFEMFDEEKKLILSATSSWLVLDSATRKIRRPENIKNRLPAFPEKNALPYRANKIEDVELSERGTFHPVLFSDLDLNNHVNNARYIRRIFDYLDDEFRNKYEPDEMEINFINEGIIGDELAVLYSTFENDQSFCSIIRKKDNSKLIRTRIKWRERKIDHQ